MTRALHTIVNGEHGRFTVLRTVPVPIADFSNFEDAELFVSAAEARVDPPAPPEPSPVEAAMPPKDAAAKVAEVFAPKPDAATLIAEPSDEDWQMAIQRVRCGERVRDVADNMGLPWTKLRARWAGIVSRERREEQREEEAEGEGEKDVDPPPSRPAPAKDPGTALVTTIRNELMGGDDGYSRPPCRSRLLSWTVDEDAEISSAREDDLPQVADRLGRTLSLVKMRRQMLEASIAKEMNDA